MMKYKILNGFLAIALSAAALLISSCASVPVPVPTPITIKADEEAKKYNLALVGAIQNADKIVIKEHSNEVDFFGTVLDLNNTPQYTYALKELNIGEKILLLGNVRDLNGEAKEEDAICLFVPHHTIDFYEQGVLKSSMQICYTCSEVQWNGSRYEASQDIFRALTPTITRAGMQTDRAWDEMAKIRYEEENRAKPPEPNPKPGGVPTAKWAPGQKGKKVINPFTGKLVDVEGIPARTKVRDHNDQDPTHIFRVPSV